MKGQGKGMSLQKLFTLCQGNIHSANMEPRNAGFFLFINLSPWLGLVEPTKAPEAEYQLAQLLLDAGVGLHPCEEHFEKPGYFRLVFSQEKTALVEGLKR